MKGASLLEGRAKRSPQRYIVPETIGRNIDMRRQIKPTPEPGYEVVWPLGKSVYQAQVSATRVSDLNGKMVCELSDWLFKSEEIFPMIRELLLRRYPGIKFVDYTVFGNIHGPREVEVMASLPNLLRKHGCDAVIAGMGS